MKILRSVGNRLFIISLSGALATGAVLATLFNMSVDLPADQAEKRVRVYLTKQISGLLIQVNNEYPSGYEKEKKLADLAEQLKKINAIIITSIEVKKLLPDVFIRPHNPAYIVRVEMHTESKSFPARFLAPVVKHGYRNH